MKIDICKKENEKNINNKKERIRISYTPLYVHVQGRLTNGQKKENKSAHDRLTIGIRIAAVGAARGSVRLGHSASLHSHGSLHPQFASPGLCFAKPLFGLANRRIPRTLSDSFEGMTGRLGNGFVGTLR